MRIIATILSLYDMTTEYCQCFCVHDIFKGQYKHLITQTRVPGGMIPLEKYRYSEIGQNLK